jgi:hypothetical protein
LAGLRRALAPRRPAGRRGRRPARGPAASQAEGEHRRGAPARQVEASRQLPVVNDVDRKLVRARLAVDGALVQAVEYADARQPAERAVVRGREPGAGVPVPVERGCRGEGVRARDRGRVHGEGRVDYGQCAVCAVCARARPPCLRDAAGGRARVMRRLTRKRARPRRELQPCGPLGRQGRGRAAADLWRSGRSDRSRC